jgi:hypothetical protein
VSWRQWSSSFRLLLSRRSSRKSRIQNLRRTRDLLLPRLLSGQIDVEAMNHA